jgi:hypothetical protein
MVLLARIRPVVKRTYMASNPSRAVFVIAAFGIVSATFIASAAPQVGQAARPVASLAAAKPVGLADAAAAMPTVAGFYTLPNGDVPGMRVSFVQNKDALTAIWTDPQGKPYGRGTYRWDANAGSFKGTSTIRHMCLEDSLFPTATVLVREELYVLNDRELRDRWTKPLNVDCSVGLVEVFKWTEDLWLATDKDWKPLAPPQAPSDSLVVAR